MKKKLALLLALAMVLSMLTACGSKETTPPATSSAAGTSAAEDEWYDEPLFVLSYADQNAETAPSSPYTKAAAEKVYQDTKGAVRIDTYYSESLIKYSEMFSGLCQGLSDISYLMSSQVEATLCTPLIWERLYPAGAPSMDILDGIYNDMLVDAPMIQEETMAAGAMWLAAGATPGRHLFSSKGFYISPDDIVGKNIGANGADMLVYDEIGASAVKLATSERYTSLQTGLIEAYSTHYNSWDNLSLQEVTSYATEFSNGGLQCQAYGFAVNLDTWNKLPAEYQEIIQNAYVEACGEMRDMNYELEQSVRKDAVENWNLQIHTLTADEMAEWAPYIETVNQKWIDDCAAKGYDVTGMYQMLLDKIEAAKK